MTYGYERRPDHTAVADARSRAHQAVERLGGQVFTLSPTNDAARQALADASERHLAAVGLLNSARTLVDVQMAHQSANEGLHFVGIARDAMGLAAGPETRAVSQFAADPPAHPGWGWQTPGISQSFAGTPPAIVINNQVGPLPYPYARPYPVRKPPKSMALALVLTLFFGPLGLLYATVTGGLIMLCVGLITALFTLGLSAPTIWLGCMVWAAVAVNSHNQRC